MLAAFKDLHFYFFSYGYSYLRKAGQIVSNGILLFLFKRFLLFVWTL